MFEYYIPIVAGTPIFRLQDMNETIINKIVFMVYFYSVLCYTNLPLFYYNTF